MRKISGHVEDFMRGYPFLSKFLRQGIVNYKALARMIEPEISAKVGEKVSVGAIAVSLQRLHARDKDKIYNLTGRLRGVKVISNLTAFSSNNPSAIYKILSSLHTAAHLHKPFALVLSTEPETVFLVEKSAKEPFYIHATQLGLLEQDLRFAGLIVSRERLSNTNYASLSYPLQVLAEHGIEVRAVSATFSEEIIIVEEVMADKAASILRHAMWR